jgi:hypothetical protein
MNRSIHISRVRSRERRVWCVCVFVVGEALSAARGSGVSFGDSVRRQRLATVVRVGFVCIIVDRRSAWSVSVMKESCYSSVAVIQEQNKNR